MLYLVVWCIRGKMFLLVVWCVTGNTLLLNVWCMMGNTLPTGCQVYCRQHNANWFSVFWVV